MADILAAAAEGTDPSAKRRKLAIDGLTSTLLDTLRTAALHLAACDGELLKPSALGAPDLRRAI
jgi:hypothetical protein